MSANDRYFKNYDYDLLHLTADRRGFVVGQSRLGISKLRDELGEIEEIKGGFTSITATCSVSVVEGSWLTPDVSTLGITTRDESVFRVSDGDELQLSYGGRIIFTGYVSESSLASEIDENDEEEFSVQLTARGYEQIKNGLPAAGTAAVLYSNGTGVDAEAPVVSWPAELVFQRLQEVTGRTLFATRIGQYWALQALYERVGVESDITGTQGEIVADLSRRVGLIPDMSSGSSITMFSYQDAAYWAFEDEHVVSGYEVAVDRDMASSVSVVRKEDTTFVRNFRSGSSRSGSQVTISTPEASEWDMASVPARVPLISKPDRYLAGLRIPRSDDFDLVTHMPLQISYRRAGLGTLRGAALSMIHSISKERWMIDITAGPVELVTRVGQLNPMPPTHVRVSLNGQVATLHWATQDVATITANAVALNQFTLDATLDGAGSVNNISVGELLRVFDHTGAEKEDTLFRITAIAAPLLGRIKVSVSPSPATPIVVGDIVRHADFGVTPFDYEVLWQARPQGSGDGNLVITPTSPGQPVNSSTSNVDNLSVFPLSNGYDYNFTVYARTSEPNVRSSASLTVTTSVGEPADLVITDLVAGDSTVEIDWSWSGVTLTGFKVGRDGIDANGFGAYETVLDAATFTVTFDKLSIGTTYHVYVAAMSGTTELERITSTVTTTGTGGGGPADPTFPSGSMPLVAFSGLPFNSLVFLPNTTAAGAVAFGNQRQRPIDGLMFFPPRENWNDLNFVQPDHAAWVQSGHILVTTIPIAPNQEGTQMLTRGANDAYAAQQRALGALIASRGMNLVTHVLRLNWECNGDWYNWAIKNGGVGAFKLAFQNCVKNLRAGGATKVLIDLCFNKGPSQSGADFAVFPGAEYCDIVGVDAYDWFGATFDDGDWATEIARTPGLQTVRDLAVANGIQWSLDEGGNVHQSPGGGDNVFYWQKMREFFYDPDNIRNCAWHMTYNEGGAPATLLHAFEYNPNAYAYYKLTANWGGF